MTETLAFDIATPIRTNVVVVEAPIRVLLVEDDAETAELVEIQLAEDTRDAFRLEWASNLVEGLIRLARPGIDVVLLDLGLPEASGYRSYRAIEAASAGKVPVVVFTSDERSASRSLTLSLGAAGYLVKQWSSPDQLRRALRAASNGSAT